MNNGKAMYYRKSDEWVTPRELFQKYDDIYHFDLDAAASDENAQVPTYFTKEDNALCQKWHGNVWCNPPYSLCANFVWKAMFEVIEGNCETVVMLLPSRTDTLWFHRLLANQDIVDIDFLRGRLKFEGAKHNAPFPSIIVVIGKWVSK